MKLSNLRVVMIIIGGIFTELGSGHRPGQRRSGKVLPVSILFSLIFIFLVAASCSPGDEQTEARGVDAGIGSTTAVGNGDPLETVPDITPVSGPRSVLLPPAPQAQAAPATAGGLAGRIVCIDPGHAATTDPGTEPIGPGAAEMKVKDPGGTSGVVTGVREPVVTLAIAAQLRQLLEAEGATVVMTREGPDFTGGNRERAQVANNSGADLFIRIHADGSSDPSRSGVSTLYPATIPGWTDDIHDASRAAADALQSAMVAGLGAPDLGTTARSDISGFNWADVPAILVEVGFMSNPREDRLLNDPAYQQQIAASLLAGIRAYFG